MLLCLQQECAFNILQALSDSHSINPHLCPPHARYSALRISCPLIHPFPLSLFTHPPLARALSLAISPITAKKNGQTLGMATGACTARQSMAKQISCCLRASHLVADLQGCGACESALVTLSAEVLCSPMSTVTVSSGRRLQAQQCGQAQHFVSTRKQSWTARL